MNIIPPKNFKRKTVVATSEEIEVQKQIRKERTYIIQAHAVKVMKAQKTYPFQNLMADVMRNITMFKAEPAMIKDQLAHLI